MILVLEPLRVEEWVKALYLIFLRRE